MRSFQELKWDETKQMHNSSSKASLKSLSVATYRYVTFYKRIVCEGLSHVHHLLAGMLVKLGRGEKAPTSTEPPTTKKNIITISRFIYWPQGLQPLISCTDKILLFTSVMWQGRGKNHPTVLLQTNDQDELW